MRVTSKEINKKLSNLSGWSSDGHSGPWSGWIHSWRASTHGILCLASPEILHWDSESKRLNIFQLSFLSNIDQLNPQTAYPIDVLDMFVWQVTRFLVLDLAFDYVKVIPLKCMYSESSSLIKENKKLIPKRFREIHMSQDWSLKEIKYFYFRLCAGEHSSHVCSSSS